MAHRPAARGLGRGLVLLLASLLGTPLARSELVQPQPPAKGAVPSSIDWGTRRESSVSAAACAASTTTADARSTDRAIADDACGRTEDRPPPSSSRWERLVAIPDLHGDLEHARRSFRIAGLTRADTGEDSWAAPAGTHLVQTGDVLDRGDQSIAILNVLDAMATDAAASGGSVTALLGNHELMTLTDDLSYVARDEIARLGKASLEAQGLGGDEMGTGYGLRAYWSAGQLVWKKLFRSDGVHGRRLRRNRLIAHVAGEGACRTLFSHAGVTSEHLRSHGGTVDGINADGLAAIAGDPGRRLHRHDLFDGDGPLWNRFWSMHEPAREVCAELDVVLAAVGARRMVVGHTVQEDGMTTRCDGRLHLIDVGISSRYVGRGAAWSCEDGVVRAHYEDETTVLEGGEAGAREGARRGRAREDGSSEGGDGLEGEGVGGRGGFGRLWW